MLGLIKPVPCQYQAPHLHPSVYLVYILINSSNTNTYDQVTNYLDIMIFFGKNYFWAQEAQHPQFLLQWPLTLYMMRSIFFGANPNGP